MTSAGVMMALDPTWESVAQEPEGLSGSWEGQVPRQDEQEIDRQEQIGILAYQLWEQRGCPDGSAEQDWYEAERRLEREASSSE